MIKKIAIGVGVVLLLLIAAAAAIPFLVPTEAVTSRVIAMVRDATGRELRIEGPVEIAFFPAIAVRMSDVALANVEGATEPDMISLGELDVRVALLPLLGGEVEIARFVLREPAIVLEVAEDGVPNWKFGGSEEAAAGEEEAVPAEEAGQEGGSPLEALTLGDVQIVDGTVTYIDHRTDETTVLSEVNVTAALGDLSGPVSVTGDAVFRDVAVTLDLSADDAGALIAGASTPVNLSLASEPITLSFEGTASGGAAPGGSGQLALDVPSLADLASWLKQPLPARAPAGALSIAGEVEATPARVAVEGLAIEVEDMSAEGDLAVALEGERPLITGALTVTRLDLDRFMGDEATSAEGEDGGEDAPAEEAAENVPTAAGGDAPVDFSALLMADADVTLDLAGVSFGDTSIGATTVQAVLQAGNLDLTTSDAAMFGGTASVNLSASATSQSVALAANLAQIDLAALPLPVEGVDGVSGRVTGIVQGHSEGGTVAALRENADGEAALTITDAGATYQPEGMAEPLTLTGLRAQVNADMSRVAVSDMAMTVADIPVSGTLTLGLAGARPSISGAIDTGHIDVDRLMETFAAAPAGEGAGSGGGGASSGDQAAEEGWSTEAIDLSALQMVDAALTLGAEGLTIQQVETGPTTISVNLVNGELETRLSETSVFEGTIGGVVRASAAGETPSFAAELEMLDVQAEPLLVRLADSDRLSGRMSGNLDVTASGRSQREIVGALDGTGAVLFSDGALKGVNIAAMLRNLGGAFDQANAGQAQQTDFAKLGGTFQIADGVVTTNDLRMLAPLFRIEGTGQANLVTRTVDFRLEPKLVATIEGQGGEFEQGGLMVPIIVSGPFNDISYRPDLAGAVESIVSDPEAVQNQLESLSEQAEQLGEDPEATIRGVLQGLTGGAAQPPATTPAPAPAEVAPTGEPAPAEPAPAESAPAEPAPEQQPADPAQQLLEGIFGN